MKKSGFLLFMREIFRSPVKIGAALPSSRYLADKIAAEIPLPNDHYIVELGGGTGVVTEALLKRGIAEQQIIVIEQSASLAKHLSEKFPHVKIIQGDAAHLVSLLSHLNIQVSSIVSSLPLRNMPEETIQAIAKQIKALLPADGRYIQYTYLWWKQDKYLSEYFNHLHSTHVWLNVPPAKN